MISKSAYFSLLKKKCGDGKINIYGMPAVFGYEENYQDKWCNPPRRGRFIGWWSSKQYEGKNVLIIIVIDWPECNLPKEVCGNPPKSENCIMFREWYGTKAWNEIPEDIAYESLVALPIILHSAEITKITINETLLPRNGTLEWILNKQAVVTVFFKNTSSAAGRFKLTYERNGVKKTYTTSTIQPNEESSITCESFTPTREGKINIKAIIEP